ncbi:methionine ABC transporter ATP-binding protein [Campylobacter sp. RM12327]|uniref:methionine ABC transporter ATP-binding protein n=1 Tax=Campylobacter sputorum TaxID=206 RepID=UPI000B79982C|nr:MULTISPECIES: methionine ABC transporter ATP-binding protein [Campylobacter]ASM40227.1 DL-methionine ABC transporter MetINQ, ATP-binding protein [Campylobacter sputorum]MBE7358515.1 methionine ABC transporter ATP-binding protein [Campylobacter sp. RM11302]MBF6669758.1 methionine ABC transporter ATP-binding protein [Campylobacter sp. RM12327]MBF6674954.1 methionine ABC transporter ATP-binding protein [Campylobacter sp. RM13538]MBF6676346.1 methionine ABC transporter ATP-binding protein [Camp
MIEVKNLIKYYGDIKVINDVSFSVKQGEIFALVGHSGAGKSTLLRCLNGLESYQDGSVKIDNKEIKELKEEELRKFRKDVGMIFQHFALMSRKTVFENIATPLVFWKYDKDYIKKRVNELLDIVGLEHKMNSYPKELSGGQKQRVAIARALALNPKILLSDEATSALDPNTTKQILELLKDINSKFGITIIIVTHEMEVVKTIAHNAILLKDGIITNKGKVHELFLKPDENMREFLGEEMILPDSGINIALYFPKEVAFECVITSMARELDINFNIVWGKIEQLSDLVLGHLVINVESEHKEKVVNFIKKTGVLWEILE